MSEREKIKDVVKIDSDFFIKISSTINSINEFKQFFESSLEEETSVILDIILSSSIILKCSDVHLEAEEKSVKLRARIDGILQDISSFSPKIFESILSRIKLLSNIKLNIQSRPQDGNFSVISPILKEEKRKIIVDGKESIEVRVSTLPSEYGESIVMRFLNPKSLVEIKDLGLRPDIEETFKKEIKRPNGMIIVTGPTGSGKTTTLYAILKSIHRPEIKIITIEDPIEYRLVGISQTEVRPDKGYDFAGGLKSIARQDPDVILVGEIRDLETAQIALQSALTGHLVLTTLHTNDSSGTIARLQSLGEEPHNIAPAINLIIAQRLVRRVCKFCTQLEKIDKKDFEEFKLKLKNVPKEIISFSENSKIPKTIGCEKCNYTGYNKRIGIFELFSVNSEIEKMIMSSATATELREKAIENGMITMYQDGLIKVLQGITTIEEVKRVAE